ncbi:MAG TPA: MoxR family ATPase [Candidatus Krumholzibacteria bacterium]|nr:MoxR family ATPase [Candidatus Krumholzibacteria bacterium]
MERLGALRERLYSEIGKSIVGQRQVIDELLLTLFAGGHVLLEGVPGLAKTLLISSVARAFNLEFKRIQFTPDLMPSDVTGSEVLEEDQSTGQRVFQFIRGPIFANIVLADEINRTPPKTQAALLQAMQERQVTIAGKTYDLDPPFFVLATQNPIEQEGTYPLPEAQLDRFMFNIRIDYPELAEELEVVHRTTGAPGDGVEPVMTGEEVLEFQRLVRGVPAADNVVEYAVRLTRLTRSRTDDAHPQAKEFLSWGAGPRAAQYLILGSKARAALDGRPTPSIDDVRAVALPVLRHRLVTNFHAEAEGVTTDDLIRELVAAAGD